MMKLITLVKPLSGFMLLAILMGVLGFLCAQFITIFGGFAMLHVIGQDAPISLTAIFVSVILFAVLRAFLRYGEQSCNHFIAFKLLAFIRDKVFATLRKLCPAKLEGRDRGDLISVITSDIELLEVFYAHTISPIAIAVIMSVLMTIFIGTYHPILGVIALLAYLTVGCIVPLIISKKNGDSGDRFRRNSGDLSAFVLDSIRGIGESIQYHSGEKRLGELNKRTDDLSAEQAKMSRMTGFNTAFTNTIILLFDIAMLTAAGVLYTKNLIDFSGLLISVIALMSSFGSTVSLANLGSMLQNTFAAGNRVLDILEETPVTEEITGKPEISFSGAECEHLTFSYGNETILSDFSVSLPENRITGISGKSGSGKSTLLKLLMRFWNVNAGKILISGTDVNEINTNNLRDMESFVTQETHLFHDTIENNIRIARLDASHEEIVEACKKASVHDFIMSLPDGYDTQVGELGETLSGGERQRIGLARAFLHDAPFLLLDEPTSNLDSLNEAVILKSLQEESEGKTVVLVSHRESTMRICDMVYSVENGRMS